MKTAALFVCAWIVALLLAEGVLRFLPPTRLGFDYADGQFQLPREYAMEQAASYALVSASTPHGVFGAKAGLERLKRAYSGMRELGWELDGPDRRLARVCDDATGSDLATQLMRDPFAAQ